MTNAVTALTDPALYTEGDPHAAWRALRRDRPVSQQEPDGFEPFWAVTTHQLGLRVLTDVDRFTSTRGTFLRANHSAPYPGGGAMMALTDPPRHSVLRRVISPAFTTRAAAATEERARHAVRSVLDDAAAVGRFNFVREVAGKLSLTVLGDLFGVPDADHAWVQRYADIATDTFTDIGGLDGATAHVELLAYYNDLLAERRGDPGDDILSAFVQAQADGLDISDDDILLTCDNVIVAANDTTRHAASACALWLLDHPDAWALLRRGEIDLRTAIEEVLRWDPPVIHVMRTALADTELGGETIRAGEPVTVWLASINRDETVFDRADELVLDRTPNRHVAFGGGPHFCIGAPLARVMIRVLLEELLHHPAGIALDGPPTRRGTHAIAGLRAVPVRMG
ncbi:cytochrome P450 [Dactylosporangium sp. AC04546]|uniref:cytochrome P450 n=1 Tax=Dactylosporangium sp. AC04546 TaxID=2862460 RepID=UPI001EE01A27|nr:cytochrome P450 [Dactylosporangium sp. AC04546]WVK88758.1 cytochrome P450 [Dactylosporangium sp. AC04546]